VSRAQPGDREVAAWGTAVVAGERVAACACGGEDCPAALLNRCVCLLVPATAAEEEGQGRCSRERAQVFSACCRCGRASSVRAAATRRGRAGLSPPGCGRAAVRCEWRWHTPRCCIGPRARGPCRPPRRRPCRGCRRRGSATFE